LASAREVTTASHAKITYLPASQTLVLSGIHANNTAAVLAMDLDGNVADTSPWNGLTRTLTSAASAAAAIAMSSAGEPTENTGWAIARYSPGAGTTGIPVALRTPQGAWPLAMLSDRYGAEVLFSENSRRESFVRIAPDGSATLLATRAGSQGSIVSTADGYILAGHQIADTRSRAIDLVFLVCPRTNYIPTSVGAQTNSSPSPSTTNSTPNDATTPSDASSAPNT
jgi:hypothetical protein